MAVYLRRSRRSCRRSVRIDGCFGGSGDEACDAGEGDVSDECRTALELPWRRRLGKSDTEPIFFMC